MARAIREETVTPADELRMLLADSEKLLGRLAGSGIAARKLLENMDRLAELWPQLEAAGVDLRGEEGRRKTLAARVQKSAASLAREIGAGTLRGERASRFPGGDAPWWWRLDEEVRTHNTRWWSRAAGLVVSLVVIGALAVFVFNRLFPVDPNVRAAAQRQLAGQQRVDNEDFEGARAEFQAAVELTPNDPDAWLWLGVSQQKLGEEAGAQQSFLRAQALVADGVTLRLLRAPIYLMYLMTEQAEADINAILQVDPENPRAHFYLASILELQGKPAEAVAALERASTYADAREEVELTAMARYRMGILIQQIQVGALRDPTPAP